MLRAPMIRLGVLSEKELDKVIRNFIRIYKLQLKIRLRKSLRIAK